GIARAVRAEPGSDERCPAILSWEEIALESELATRFSHLIALDPPTVPGGEALLAAAPFDGPVPGAVHLAWGRPEVEFALAVLTRDLNVRVPVAAVYRRLRATARPLSGDELEPALAGEAADPGRLTPGMCARAVRILGELELV